MNALGKARRGQHDYLNPFKTMANLADFLYLYDHAHHDVSKLHCERLISQTRRGIELTLRDKTAVYGWSGGKDSVVLEYILRPFGLHGVCALTQLEYPIVEHFVQRFCPPLVKVVRTEHGIEWLKRNPRFLLPRDTRTKSEWYKIVQQNGLDDFAHERFASLVVTGRRRSDGNSIPSLIYTPKNAPTRYAPLMNFTHAEVWAIMRHYELPEYPLYTLHPTSLITGTGCWAQEPSWEIVKGTDRELFERVRPQFL